MTGLSSSASLRLRGDSRLYTASMSTLPQQSAARRVLPAVLIALVLSVYALWDLRHAPEHAYPVLDAQLTALHQAFDRDRGHVRMLLILDPT